MTSSNDSRTPSAGELITLSFGPAANDITALYLNQQWDEVRDTLLSSASPAAEAAISSTIDWRTLFRTVTSTTSSTPHFIPRLIALSLPSQTGYYPGIGDVLDYSALLSSASRPASSSASQWSGRTLLRADPDELAALQQRQRSGGNGGMGAGGDECWTDWLRLERLHEKNVHRLKPLQNEDDAFEYFTLGQETIQQQHGVDDVLDRVRWFAEECDHLQGIQLITDATNAWAGVADATVNALRDEYDRTPLISLALHSPLRPTAASFDRPGLNHDVIPMSRLNSILSLTHLSEECDLYVPLFTPDALASSPYIDKARQLALLWHHLSLPYCRTGPNTDMRRMCNRQRPAHTHTSLRPLLVPHNHANVLGCSMAMQSSPVTFCEFAHPTSAQPPRLQQHMLARAQQEDRPTTWRIHSLPNMQRFQPVHTTTHSATSSAYGASRSADSSFGSSAGRQQSARHSRRKGAQVRDEDGEADDDDDDGSGSSSSTEPHFLLAEFLIARGVPDAALSHFLADVTAMDPFDSRQLCLTEAGVRVVRREERKEGRGDGDATERLSSVCSVYSCDAIGDWLRAMSALAGDVRRDAARGLVKMGREEGSMSTDDWSDCASALRDKAEAYYINTAHL